jgi:drug/metabolite transporter (DMT)-like permease
MKLKHWLWLLVVQIIWASSYVAMKVAVSEMPVSGVVFLRYGIAAVGFTGIWLFSGFPRLARRDLLLIVLLGGLSFALAPILQITGLQYTQAVDVSILISFEPLITVLVAAIALREHPSRRTIITLAIATAGLMILSGASMSGEAGSRSLRLLGNLLFLFALVFEGAVSVSGRALTVRYRPDHLIGAMMIAGFIAATLINAPVIAATDFGSITWRGWSAVLFLGLGCSIFTYVAWFRVLKDVPVNRVALSLYIQPVAGTLLGILLLGETVDASTLVGAFVICASLIWWQVRENKLAETTPDGPEQQMPELAAGAEASAD